MFKRQIIRSNIFEINIKVMSNKFNKLVKNSKRWASDIFILISFAFLLYFTDSMGINCI